LRIRADEAHLPHLRHHLGLIAAGSRGEKDRRNAFSTDLITTVRAKLPTRSRAAARRAADAGRLLDIAGSVDDALANKGDHPRNRHVSARVAGDAEIGRDQFMAKTPTSLLAEAADELVKEAMS